MYSEIFRPINTQQHNLNLVLKKIKGEGPLSRADIARTLNCSKSTVTNIINQLIDYGLVRETGKGNPVTGRKSTLLEFNPKSNFVIALDARPQHMNLAILDLSGSEVLSATLKARDTRPEVLIPELIRGLERLIEKSGLEKTAISAIGISISGIVDPIKGVVLFSALLNWKERVDLKATIQDAVGLPVFIENDVNALALAEYWLGCGQAAASIAYIYLDEKIGGAYIDEGFIIQGSDFAFAEFGKLIVPGDKGPEPLETRLSFPNVLARFGLSLGAPERNGEKLRGRVAELFEKNPDVKAKVYDFLSAVLRQVISSIVVILNPSVIILGGLAEFDSVYIERLTRESKALLPELPHRTIRILPATLRDQREILGAAAVALNNTRFKFIIQG